MRIARPFRRLAVVVMYGAYVAGAVMQWRVTEIGGDRPLILGLFGVAFGVGLLLFFSTRYMAWISAKDHALDEREIAVRNGVYKTAYIAVAWLSVLLLVLWYAAPLFSTPLTPQTNGNVLLWGYVLLISTLPAALLAWRDRPAPG